MDGPAGADFERITIAEGMTEIVFWDSARKVLEYKMGEGGFDCGNIGRPPEPYDLVIVLDKIMRIVRS